MAFAHSENSAGIKHDLVEHLRSVARMAGELAGKFDAADLGYWAAAGRVIAVMGDRAGRASVGGGKLKVNVGNNRSPKSSETIAEVSP